MTVVDARSRRLIFTLVWLLFITKSIIYIALTPMWEGFDELFHFAYVQSLASIHSLPVWGHTFIDSEIEQSTAYVPLPGLMPQLAAGFEKLSYHDYSKMDTVKKGILRQRLGRLQANASRFDPSDTLLYQVQHPPLYYALCAPLYKALEGRSIVEKVYALRFFSVLLASLSVLAAALIAREGKAPFVAFFAGFVALWPCLYVDVGRVGNDSLGVAVYSFIFYFMLRFGNKPTMKNACTFGVFLGLGLLTKAYFLPAIPAFALFTGFLALKKKEQSRRILLGVCLAMLCAAVIGGWWYLRNFRLYGSFSGLQETMYFPSVGISERIRAAVAVPWTLIMKNIFVTFSWVNGWSFLHLPKPAYSVFVILFLVAAVGLAKGLPFRNPQPGLSEQRYGLAASVCLFSWFSLGVAYHAVNAYATVGRVGGPGGWYFYALVVPISYAVSLGFSGIPPRFARSCFLIVYLGIVAAEVSGFLMVLAPYYAGVAVPAADGWGVVFPENDVLVSSIEAVKRLTEGKTPASLFILFAISYLVVHTAVLRVALAAAEASSKS
ncbi:MAG: glycosyltransferase family 39 protein [Candidatus Lindowbacteria bacterium]|nr:glycosyltransferase family 39 protein [Candidatus Lindowbacteria bacterium]